MAETFVLDHFMLATPDLIATAAEMFGMRASDIESALSISSANGRTLAKFRVDHPQSCGLAELYAALSIDQEVSVWLTVPSLEMPLNAPRGAVMF